MRFSGTVFTGPRVHVWTVDQLGEKKFSVFKQQQQQQQQGGPKFGEIVVLTNLLKAEF